MAIYLWHRSAKRCEELGSSYAPYDLHYVEAVSQADAESYTGKRPDYMVYSLSDAPSWMLNGWCGKSG